MSFGPRWVEVAAMRRLHDEIPGLGLAADGNGAYDMADAIEIARGVGHALNLAPGATG